MQVEKLIKELPSVPADWSNGDVHLMDKNSMNNGPSFQSVENGTNLRETQSMLLERIASEMNRLKFYIAHAQVSFALSHFKFSVTSLLGYVLELLAYQFPSINSVKICVMFLQLSIFLSIA